jgi:hypothetical protein
MIFSVQKGGKIFKSIKSLQNLRLFSDTLKDRENAFEKSYIQKEE